MKKIAYLATLTAGVLCAQAFASVKSLEISQIEGEVLVKVKKNQGDSFLSRSRGLDAKIIKKMNLIQGDIFVLKSLGVSSLGLISKLHTFNEVEFAEPNFLYKIPTSTFNLNSLLSPEIHESSTSSFGQDPLFEKLWGLENNGRNEPDRNGDLSPVPGVVGADIAAQKAWSVSKGSANIKVAVIDTGIDYNHPDLKNNLWINSREIPGNAIDDDQNGYVDDVYGWNAHKDHGDPMDGNGHGTHCAGTIGAEHGNGIGVAGVMSEVSIMGVKFLSDEGSGSLSDAVEAIDYATKMDVDIMSNSWGGGGFSQALEGAIKAARDKGIIFVAAAGNDYSNNDSRPSYPSSYQVENVISVASHTAQDTLSAFSNFGRRAVHVAAPGSNVYSTTPGAKYSVYSGTSMATPHVSGVIGLLLAQTGRLPHRELKERLMYSTTPGAAYRKTTLSGGRVNAYHFLNDTKIPRPGPDDSLWRSEMLSEPFETIHPYANNTKISKSYTFPGAKYIKLIVEKYDTEASYDYLQIKDAKGNVVEKISGTGVNYESDYAETDSITMEFTSDSSQTKWGVSVKEVKVIY